MYQEIILDHYKNPHHKGLREPYDVEVHHVNPTCGDEVTLRVKVVDGVVEDVSYDGQGCSISQASTSMMTEKIKGLSQSDAAALAESIKAMMAGESDGDEKTLGDLVSLKGVVKYPVRIKCALLGWNTLVEALEEKTSR